MIRATLEDWSMVANVDMLDPYKAPELTVGRILGTVFVDNSNTWPDGHVIKTGTIMEFDAVNKLVRTKRNVYKLGKPSVGFTDYLNSINKTVEDYHTNIIVDEDQGELFN